MAKRHALTAALLAGSALTAPAVRRFRGRIIETKDGPAGPSAEEFKKVTDAIATAFEEFKKAHADSEKKRDAVAEEKLGKLQKTLDTLTDAKAKMDAELKAANDRADEI